MSYVKQCDKCKKILADTEKVVNVSPVDAPVKEQLHLCHACNEAFKRDFLRIQPPVTATNPQPSQPAQPVQPMQSASVNPNAVR